MWALNIIATCTKCWALVNIIVATVSCGKQAHCEQDRRHVWRISLVLVLKLVCYIFNQTFCYISNYILCYILNYRLCYMLNNILCGDSIQEIFASWLLLLLVCV